MGCYVNHATMDKGDWLLKHGERTTGPCEITETHVPVCLVHNFEFTAAGVCFDNEERDAFNRPFDEDHRPKIWFKVPREALYAVSDLKNWEKYTSGTRIRGEVTLD